jgi:sialidase-1
MKRMTLFLLSIFMTWGAMASVTDVKITYKAVVDGWTSANPNTHFGGITLTCNEVANPITIKTQHLAASEMNVDVSGDISLSFTRKYRGFDFVGFSIGKADLGQSPTLTSKQKKQLAKGTPLVVKFKTDGTKDVTLFYDDDPKSYRIPAIATTATGRIIAVSDYRHSLDDIGRDVHRTGSMRIDLVARTSDDNGATWSQPQTIAQGDDNQVGSYLRAFGDATIAAYGTNILVMAAAGDVIYPGGTAENPNRMARIYSTDNGETWHIEEMTRKVYADSNSLIPDGVSSFFGSGKLAVDPDFNGTGKARVYGAVLIKNAERSDNNYVLYTDDLGATWNILGGSQTPVAFASEPKVDILPNGQILLSARRQGGRTFNVFTYLDKATGSGIWDKTVDGCDNGGKNGTDGEVMCVDAQKADGTTVKLLLQSQPKGGASHYDRRDVTIWYKEVSPDATYTSADMADGWTQGKQLSTVLSSYSAMCLQQDGNVAFFFEEAPCYEDDYTKGYCMVYLCLSVEEITEGKYSSVKK